MEKSYWLINVSGKNGYSMMVYCDAEDEDEAVEMAADAGLFNDEEDADYAYAEEASGSDIKHFTEFNMVQEI